MKNYFKRSLLLFCASTILLTFVACGGTSNTTGTTAPTANTSGEEKAVTVRWATSVSQNEIDSNKTPTAITINTWVKTVEEASKGTINVEVFGGSQLANGTDDTISGVLNGAFEMAQINTGSWGDYTNAFAALNVPYLYTDFSEVHKVMDSDFGKSMLDQVKKDVGVVPLCYGDIGYRHITNSKGIIKSPADLAGLKIRTMTDSVQISAMNDLGAAVTPLAISELFSALQQKLVDAQENPLSTIYAQKYYEVQKFCTLTKHSYTTTILFMNEQFFNGLSDSQKAAIETANDAATNAGRAVLESSEIENKQKLETAGMQFYELSDSEMAAFQNSVKPTWEKVKSAMGEQKWNELMATIEK